MKVVYITIILFALTLNVAAQDKDNLKKEVNVTRAYEPSVDDSFKQGINPDMTDTTRITPEFKYSITPTPVSYNFLLSPLSPVKVNTIENQTSYPFYVKAGLGFPLQSVLDVEYNTKLSERSKVGGSLTHYGEYAKILNDQGVKAPATQSSNNLSLFGERTLRSDLILTGDLSYDFRYVTRFGYYYFGEPIPLHFNTSSDALAQFFHTLRGFTTIGNSFTDFSKVNFRVGAEVAYLADRYKYDVVNGRAIAELGFGVGSYSNVRIRANHSIRRGQNNLSNYKSDQLTTGAMLNYKMPDDVSFSIGADLSFDLKEHKNYFLPLFNIEKSLYDDMLIPYFVLDSKVVNNNYLYLSYMNPYIREGLTMPQTTEYDGRVGIRGTVFDKLRYKVYGGYSLFKDMPFFYNMYNERSYGNLFDAVEDDIRVWTGGVELDFNITSNFTINGSTQVYNYNLDHLKAAPGLPDVEFAFGASYNYLNKFYLNWGTTIYGERFFLEQRILDLQFTKADMMIDMNLSTEYYLNKKFGLYLNLNNILNQRLYRFNRYPLLGINVQGGVKLSF